MVDLYEQYVHDVGNVLGRHAPVISRLAKKDSVDWMSNDYQRLRGIGVGPINSLNRNWLHCQIA